jgi:hypothetical protein
MSADSLWTDFYAPALPPARHTRGGAMSMLRLLANWLAITALCAGLGVLLS